MNRKRECLQAYFAGLFDGEGTVGLYFYEDNRNKRKYPSFKACIRMQEFVGVGLLQREYPGSFYTYDCNGKPMYVWQVQGNQAHDFLKEIKPYVIVKHEQVALALSWLVMYRRYKAVGGSYPDEYYNRSQWFVDKIKEKKLPNGKNSVNALVKHGMREYRAELADLEQDIEFLNNLLEGVETRHSDSNRVEATSIPEKDIVQPS